MTTTPILFLIFNRPDTTERVFETIRKARPSKLYVAADGARKDKMGEAAIVKKVRKIATNIDWDCELATFFHEKNLGCKMAVSSAITWFFEHEEEGIILEDDCLPTQSFFPFCQDLLEKYRHNNQVMIISGNNFQNGKKRTEDSYYFSKYSHIWGWASWKRAWKYWDGDLSSWPEFKKRRVLKKLSSGHVGFECYWESIFDACYAGKINTWDYAWLYSIWTQGGVGIIPSVNLVSNIGFGEGATHAKEESPMSRIPSEEIGFPLRHPVLILKNLEADHYTDEHHYGLHRQSTRKPSLVDKLLRTISLINRGI